MVRKITALLVAASMTLSIAFTASAQDEAVEQTTVTAEETVDEPTTSEGMPEQEEVTQPQEDETQQMPDDGEEGVTAAGIGMYLLSFGILTLALPLSFLAVPLSVLLIWFPPLSAAMVMMPVGVLEAFGTQFEAFTEYIKG